MRIFLVVSIVIVLGIVGGLVAFGPDFSSGFSFGSDSGDRGESVRVESVVRRTLVERVAAPGEIEPNVKVDVSAEVSARILELPFREGESVQAGELIIRLDAADFEARLESARARRDAEQFRLQSEQSRIAGPMASLANARTVLERQEQLFATGDVSRQSLDDARNRVAELAAQVEAGKLAISVIESSLQAAEADIDQARDRLGKTIMKSPIDGVITILNAEVGELVVVGTMNNAGTIIMTIADLSRMRLDAKVAESDIAKVENTQPAEIRINAYPDEVFDGTVERIALQRSLDRDGSGYFKTEVQLELAGRRIYSGLAANVDIEIARHEGLVVPSQAVVDMKVDELPSDVRNVDLVDSDRRTVPVVFVVEDGKARCTPVRIGPSSLAETIISEGIEPGASVVIGPYKAIEDLEDGDAVKVDSGLRATDDGDDSGTKDAGSKDAGSKAGDGSIKVSF
ncbi:MAG: efflux RND transporter periplasmic adaptor subunit [Phycisphaerales bacterium]|nr:efflux RND transporter periplasmic adaptor subunit [Phycisphaerales bacterium]